MTLTSFFFFCFFSLSQTCSNRFIQVRTVYPGVEAKLSSTLDLQGGWYNGTFAVLRRLIMTRDELNHDGCTVQNKTTINFLKVDRSRATIIMKALREYENTVISSILGQRQVVRTGKAVSDYIKDAAAMTKRLFTRLTPERKRRACEKYENPIEADKCYPRLRTVEDKAVLRFCYCNSKSIIKYSSVVCPVGSNHKKL